MLFVFNCEGNLENTGPIYTRITEDHSQGYIYPPGYYYEYKVITHDDKINPLEMFFLLSEENIIVEEAWYRQYLTGCKPPNSQGMTTTIYPNILIVRLALPEDKIELYKFKSLNLPNPIPCGYRVSRYRLKKTL